MKKRLTIAEGDTKYLDPERRVTILKVKRHSTGGAPAQNVVEVEIEEPDPVPMHETTDDDSHETTDSVQSASDTPEPSGSPLSSD